MPAFYGTEQHIALQSAAEVALDWLAQTPGACNAGRFLVTDDPEQLGWNTIFEILGRDQIFNFSLVSSEDIGELEERLQQRNFRIDIYDVFVASAAEATASVSLILETGCQMALILALRWLMLGKPYINTDVSTGAFFAPIDQPGAGRYARRCGVPRCTSR